MGVNVHLILNDLFEKLTDWILMKRNKNHQVVFLKSIIYTFDFSAFKRRVTYYNSSLFPKGGLGHGFAF